MMPPFYVPLLQQLNAVVAASMSLKSSTKLRQILEVSFLKNKYWVSMFIWVVGKTLGNFKV